MRLSLRCARNIGTSEAVRVVHHRIRKWDGCFLQPLQWHNSRRRLYPRRSLPLMPVLADQGVLPRNPRSLASHQFIRKQAWCVPRHARISFIVEMLCQPQLYVPALSEVNPAPLIGDSARRSSANDRAAASISYARSERAFGVVVGECHALRRSCCRAPSKAVQSSLTRKMSPSEV